MLGTVGPAGGFSKNGPQAPGGPTMPVPVTRAEPTRWRARPCRRASLSATDRPGSGARAGWRRKIWRQTISKLYNSVMSEIPFQNLHFLNRRILLLEVCRSGCILSRHQAPVVGLSTLCFICSR